MKYTKPEVVSLGYASAAVRGVGKLDPIGTDTEDPTNPHVFQPAYQADE